MTKICNKVFFILIGCSFMMFMSACHNSDTESSSVGDDTKSDSVFMPLYEEESSSTLDNIESGSTFKYPDQSEFSLSAEIKNSNVKSGDSFIIDCSLKNNSDRDFYIEHGSQIFTYSYNGESEFHTLVAILTNFKSNDKLERTLDIAAKKSGTITIETEIRVKPDAYSDFYKTYTFTKEIEVTVQ